MVVNGYGELLRVMGRKFSDFLKGMDNLHEYFRFRYGETKKTHLNIGPKYQTIL